MPLPDTGGPPPSPNPGPYRLADYLAAESAFNRLFGLVPAAHHLHALHGSLTLDARARGFERIETYLSDLFLKGEAADALSVYVPRLTIQESYFFRFEEQLRLLPPLVLERLNRHAGQPTLIWSAGCSTGEEPYSLAMLLFDHLHPDDFERLQILAGDINPDALETARRARYGYWSFRNMADEQMDRFFDHDEGAFQVKEFIRRRVRFVRVNLSDPASWPFLKESAHFLFCRNVLIYFDRASIRRALEGFHAALHREGALFLGHSESTWEADDLFQVVVGPGAFFYQPRGAPVPAVVPVMAQPARARSEPSVAEAQPAGAAPPAPPEPTPPVDRPAIFRAALADANGGRLREAARGFFECMLSEELVVLANLGLAFVDIQRGKLPEAGIRIDEVLKAEPLTAVGHYLRGLLRETADERSKAMADYQRALFLEPRLVLARVHRATLLEGASNRKEARREFQQSLEDLQAERWVDPFWGEATPAWMGEFARTRLRALG